MAVQAVRFFFDSSWASTAVKVRNFKNVNFTEIEAVPALKSLDIEKIFDLSGILNWIDFKMASDHQKNFPDRPINVSVLRWAADRAQVSEETLRKKFKKWDLWLSGEVQPTFKQLEALAKMTCISFSFFFFHQLPVFKLPVPDFRTIGQKDTAEPSPNLYDTVVLCRMRQDWFHEYSLEEDQPELEFAGSASVNDSPIEAADSIRQTLGITPENWQRHSSYEQALRSLIDKADAAGILIMVNSAAGSSRSRKLDVNEFRGFALAGRLAPLIFINGSDSQSAQMFTLGYELARIWLGHTGVSNPEISDIASPESAEFWCSSVAAEIFLPLAELRKVYSPRNGLKNEIDLISKKYNISPIVVLRRIYDADFIDKNALRSFYAILKSNNVQRNCSRGRNFYDTFCLRASKRFVEALLRSTLYNQTLIRDALHLLCINKIDTIYKTAEKLGIY
ncbi:MAG: ImmA/IrrE family metallo-endopeptidase [Deltaproteobacteria bacterium]|jgi:Zn-dependent peptidase ImmA (M78 family)|nr:ImmA/IrrE family metallo-endopeptidase [Deltaproteobacteria bacterium]